MANPKKPQQNNEIYEKIKYLNKWLLDTQNKIPIDFLLKDEKLFNSNLKYRLFNMLQHHPQSVKYLNKYLNGIYDFNESDPALWLNTFKKIITDNRIDNLYFFKYQAFNIDKFNTAMKTYTEEAASIPFNSNEISNFFKLYQNGLIVLPGEQTSESTTDKNVFAEETIIKDIVKSESILSNIDMYVKYKNKRQPCGQCPAFYSKMLVYDTNLTEIKPCNILILVDIAPSDTDISKNQFLSEATGKTFRQYLQRFVDKTGATYVISTLSFCGLKTDGKKQIKSCKDFILEISKSFDPQYIVVMGAKVKTGLEIKGAISQLYGKAIGKFFIMNAISELDKKDGLIKLENAFNELELLLSKNPIVNQQVTPQTQSNTNVEYQQVTPQIQNSNITQNDTLFNIERIGEKLLYVFIDPDGNKKYNLVTPEFPIYYKKGNFSNCDYIDSKMDAVVKLTLAQKKELSTLLNQKLHNLIKC